MFVPSISRFNINGDSVAVGPIQAYPPTLKSGNLFPKYPHAINDTAWELWYFDGVSKRDEAAIVIDFSRHAESQDRGGFKVQVLGIWPDGKTWHRDLYFPESIVETSQDTGTVLGVWQDTSNGSSISFLVDADCSYAKIDVLVPGLVSGSMSLTCLPGDTGLDTATELGPSVHYMRPIGRAAVNATLTFESMSGEGHGTISSLSLSDQDSTGGMDRVWSLLSWPQIMTESYYLRGQAGSYAMQVMRIIPAPGQEAMPWTVARLYCDGTLVCAAQDVIATADKNQSHPVVDSLVISKTYGGDGSGPVLTGTFRDRNIGYTVEFIQGGESGKRWCFDVRHARTFWNMPTSAPGPNGTGNTGFVEHIKGGLEGEQYQGVALGGQCELMSRNNP
ncbi:hypothetical protein HD806DRAFT_295441 [Xylariaceae sp. AK1471]|nr:hypothetical protein HD806DRAFT_295441 [Xylariaceae sp. AK1471]